MQLEIDLMKHGPLANWTPQIGDFIFRDGVFSRWCGLVDGVFKETVNIRTAGNPRLIVTGDYKTKTIKIAKIKHAMAGSYYVATKDGSYFV